jgi:hypothetical protein
VISSLFQGDSGAGRRGVAVVGDPVERGVADRDGRDALRAGALDLDVFFFAVRAFGRGFAAVRRVRFGAALRRAVPLRATELFRAVWLPRVALRFFDDARELLRVLRIRPADDREVFREPPRPAFFVFLAT